MKRYSFGLFLFG